jgi:MFS family permease
MEEKKPKRITLSRGYRIFLWACLVSVECAINNSSGLLSSASKTIKATLNLNDKQYGLVGTAYGLGRTIGSSVFIFVNTRINAKWTCAFFVIVKGLLLVAFKLVNSGEMLVLLRGIVGIVHMPPSIYLPVWIDQFGVQKLKTLMQSVVLVVQPGGKVVGFLLHIIVGDPQWRMGFVLEGLYLCAVGLVFAVSPIKYFDNKLQVVKDPDGGEHVEVKKGKQVSKISVFEEKEDVSSGGQKKEQPSFFSDMIELLTNGTFLTSSWIRSLIYGVNTAFHFWIADYMRTVLDINSPSKIFISYTIIALAGPIGGVLCNAIINPWMGGYESQRSSYALLFLHLISCVFGVAFPLFLGLTPFSILSALYLVFNSAMLSILQGVIVSSIPSRLKSTGFSITNIVTMLVTSGPSPVIYGYINDKYKTVYKPLAMLCTMLAGVASIPFFFLLICFRARSFKKDKLLGDKKGKTQNVAEDIAGAVDPDALSKHSAVEDAKGEKEDEGRELEEK